MGHAATKPDKVNIGITKNFRGSIKRICIIYSITLYNNNNKNSSSNIFTSNDLYEMGFNSFINNNNKVNHHNHDNNYGNYISILSQNYRDGQIFQRECILFFKEKINKYLLLLFYSNLFTKKKFF